MQGFGQRLRARAQALGLSDAEVARRSGLSEQRYGNYVRGAHEPDLETLVTIARTLGSTLDSLLLGSQADQGLDPERASLETRLISASRALDLADLKIAVGQIELAAQHRRTDRSPS